PFPRAFPGRLRIRLVDGRILEAVEPFNRGSAENPLRPDEIVAKFRRNAGRVLPPSRVSALETAALGLERSASLRSLLALCALP
ncbi:MAG: MmgE/PrpD family protein, partial [candidate division NC10 bacterium]